MRRIARGAISRAAAAKALGGISERHVNRLMKRLGVTRPRSQARDLRHEARLTAQMRREAKERGAKAHLAKQCSIEQAAMQGGCSVRTAYRWVEKLRKTGKKTGKNGKNTKKSA